MQSPGTDSDFCYVPQAFKVCCSNCHIMEEIIVHNLHQKHKEVSMVGDVLLFQFLMEPYKSMICGMPMC